MDHNKKHFILWKANSTVVLVELTRLTQKLTVMDERIISVIYGKNIYILEHEPVIQNFIVENIQKFDTLAFHGQ